MTARSSATNTIDLDGMVGLPGLELKLAEL